MSRKRRWTERTRLILTLQLAIMLPAAALILFSVWNLRSIQRDRAVEAAIQRDFGYVLKIAEKRIVERARQLALTARKEFPCPDDKQAAAKIEQILRDNPHFAHAFLYDKKSNTFLARTRPDPGGDPSLAKEGDIWFHVVQSWMPMEAGTMWEKLYWMEKKEGKPQVSFSSHWVKRRDEKVLQSVVYFLPPEAQKNRVMMAGLAFDVDYLWNEFFPGMFDEVLSAHSGDSKNRMPAVMMVHFRKELTPLAASAGWDGGKPEVERNFEEVFPTLVLAIKFRGKTIEALSDSFLRTNFLIIGGLSLFLAFGVWLTYRNVTREMALAKLKSDFVANVSHELRTPLALIRLYSETLEMGRLTNPEKPQEYYRIIRKESERLTGLINNILDFSRIEAGRKEYDFRETNLAELVRNTLDAYRFQIEQHGFFFQASICDDLPPVKVDREAIARSLLNLINNAIKYSPDEKFLGVNLYRANGNVKLEVIDHGIGIPRGEQDKIFEKFYRSGDPLVHTTKGSGLGLSLVRHIVQAHGGRVSVESAPGKGSKFVIALPLPAGAQGPIN